MINWIKTKQGKWTKSNNDISSLDFYNNFQQPTKLNIDNPQNAIIYIPTHNIKDVYEWYRIFNDSYVYSDNFDKFGHGINAWFDKSRGQSIKGWFPNLIEVKASSNSEYKYTSSNIEYFRTSIDFITNFTDIAQLFIDGVKIYNNEKILLKDQYIDSLYLYNVNPNLSFANTFYIEIINEIDKSYFKVGNKIILKNTIFIEDIIISISYIEINSINYIVIKTHNDHTNISEVGDIIDGNWITNSYSEENGVYIYTDNNLKLITEMYDKYKTYNQIVYTYQGVTNMNKEFYLRRNEDQNNSNSYGNFPIFGEELNYSQGEAYLIKCELDYSLAIDSTDIIPVNQLGDCCSCIANLNLQAPSHPTGSAPYGVDTDPFRLLMLDNQMAEKVFSTTSTGIGDYHVQDVILLNDIISQSGNYDLIFSTTDVDGENNFLVDFENENLKDCPVQPSYYFKNSGVLGTVTEVTYDTLGTFSAKNVITVPFKNAVGTLIIGEDIIFSNNDTGKVELVGYSGTVGLFYFSFDGETSLEDNYTFIGQTSGATGKINISLPIPNIVPLQELTYLQSTYNSTAFPVNANILNIGDFVNISINVNIGGVENELLDYQFVTIPVEKTATDLDLLIFPPLSINVLNDLENNLFLCLDPGNTFEIKIELINTYDLYNDFTLVAQSLLNKLNKSIIGKNYDFSINEISGSYYLVYNGLRRSTKYKWYNMGMNFSYSIDNYSIEHKIEKDFRLYFYGYNFYSHLYDYLGIQTYTDVAQTGQVLLSYYDMPEDADRITIGGSVKQNGLTSYSYGNILYFGYNYKELILDNIKRNTFVEISVDFYSNNNVWVQSVEWNDELQLGTIVFLNHILIPQQYDIIDITTISDIYQISKKMNNLFEKKLNTTGSLNFDDNNLAYKPDTASYAHMLVQYGYHNDEKTMDIFNNISAVLFKDYNEPRIIFTKRDRTFAFDDDVRLQVKVASSDDENINSPTIFVIGGINTILIDSEIIYPGDNFLLAGQDINDENGVYIFDGQDIIRDESYNYTVYIEIQGGSNAGYSVKGYKSGNSIPTSFYVKNFRRKSDPRLTFKPIEFAKLGVNNETQPWKKINNKYDSEELTENLLTIQTGINSVNQIRFIDGLTEFKILNDVDGQGIYSWILHEGVLTENAIVGCEQTDGPGTGKLIWYTGTWVQGTWCNGIWIQGLWKTGTWVNGERYSYTINDYFYYVTYDEIIINNLSIWETGIWLNGTNYSGTFLNVTWYNGIMEDGIMQYVLWINGKFYGGVINYGIWETGNFYGGDFEKGIWKTGNVDGSIGLNVARLGTKSEGNSNLYKDKFIWITGTLKNGEFHSGVNNMVHNGSIFYSGIFENSEFLGGSFITGYVTAGSSFINGVYFGGYNCEILNVFGSTDIKKIIIDPTQYDEILGLINTIGYIPNASHNLYTDQKMALLGTPTSDTDFSKNAFINQYDLFNTDTYILKTSIGVNNNDSLLLNVVPFTSETTSYVQSDYVNNIVDGNPFISTPFSGDFNGGVWLNGYFKMGSFLGGIFVTGVFGDGVVGKI